jgi:hypothetical protein
MEKPGRGITDCELPSICDGSVDGSTKVTLEVVTDVD